MWACLKPEPGFPAPYAMVYIFFNAQWLLEMIVHFFDIGGIVDHHRLNFLFITDRQINSSELCKLWRKETNQKQKQQQQPEKNNNSNNKRSHLLYVQFNNVESC